MDLDRLIERIDEFFLDKIFQRFSDGFQKLTGKTCFFLAKVSFLLAAGFFELSAINGLYQTRYANWLITAIIVCLGIVMLFRIIQITGRWESRYVNGKQPVINIRRIILQFPRVVLLSATAGMSVGYLTGCLSLKSSPFDSIMRLLICCHFSIFIGLYFQSCDPLPPAKSWLKKLLKSFNNCQKELQPCKEACRS